MASSSSLGCVKAFFSIVVLFGGVLLILMTAAEFFLGGDAEAKEYVVSDTTGKNRPGITSEYQWQYMDINLNHRSYKLTMDLLKDRMEHSLVFLDSLSQLSHYELQIDPRLAGQDQARYQRYVWTAIFKRVLNRDLRMFDDIVSGLQIINALEKFSAGEYLDFLVTLVQNIEYKRPGGKLDLLTPYQTLGERYGDCDTKSMLLYVLLTRSGYRCALFWSYRYAHVMLGIAVNSSGASKQKDGVQYYFLETTYPGWRIGQMPPSVSLQHYWYLLDL